MADRFPDVTKELLEWNRTTPEHTATVCLETNWERHLLDMHNLEPVPDLLREVLDVLAVLCRQHDRLDTRPECADQLLLDSSDGRDASSERNLTLLFRTNKSCNVSIYISPGPKDILFFSRQ